MTKRGKEREIKLLAEGELDDGALVRIGEALGVRIGKPKKIRQSDTYLDDDGHHLSRAGAGLRLRRTGQGQMLCWKSNGKRHNHVFERQEIELPWRGLEPRCAADIELPIKSRVEPHVYGRRLQSVVRLDTERHVYRAARGNGRALLCVDRVRVTHDGSRHAAFAEIEIEVKKGPTRPWLELADRLRDELPLVESRLNKLQRALSLCGIAPPENDPRSITADLSMTEAGFQLFRRHFGRVQQEEVRVRVSGTPEAVHRLRVACRRLRAAFRTFEDVLPDGQAAAAGRLIRDTARAVGPVRDLDVLTAGLRGRSPELGEPFRPAAVLSALKRRRRRKLRKARALLKCRKRLRGFEALQQLLDASPHSANGVARARVADAAPELLRTAAKRAFEQGALINADSPTEDVHRLRILLKRLRYTAELFRDVYGDDLGRFIERSIHLQDVLGAYNDAEGAVAFLTKWAGRRGTRLAPHARLCAGAFIALERQRAMAAREQVASAWDEFASEEPSTHLGAALLLPRR